MSRPKKIDITDVLAEDLTSVLDYVSRVVGAADDGNVHYLHDKLRDLVRAADGAHRRLSDLSDPEPPYRYDANKWFDPRRLRRLVTRNARHYRAGRALYPADNSEIVAARRGALESAASDLRFGGPKDVPPAVADVVAGWLLARAERQATA